MIIKNRRKYTPEEREALWVKYRKDPSDQAVYNELCESYLDLVEVLAVKMKANLPLHLEIDDIVNDGFIGLMDAVSKFDESRGFKFETYATTRIRGHILDCLRSMDEVSRYTRLSFRKVGQTESALLEELQRDPTREELADRLGWTMDKLDEIQTAFANSFIGNIDEYITDNTHEAFSLQELLPDTNSPSAEELLELQNLKDRLIHGLSLLSEQESIILFMVIVEGMKFIEVSDVLDIPSNRVIKIYDDALAGLKSYLEG